MVSPGNHVTTSNILQTGLVVFVYLGTHTMMMNGKRRVWLVKANKKHLKGRKGTVNNIIIISKSKKKKIKEQVPNSLITICILTVNWACVPSWRSTSCGLGFLSLCWSCWASHQHNEVNVTIYEFHTENKSHTSKGIYPRWSMHD